MGATGIEWTIGPNGEPGFTFNPWIGCTKLSGACDHCYAETAAIKLGVEWGAERRTVGESTWNGPLVWDRRARRERRRFRVFCASMADVLDNHRSIQLAWRMRLYQMVHDTPNLDWLFLTKRPMNQHLLPRDWRDGRAPKNLWFGFTAEDQTELDRRWPHAKTLPGSVLFMSVEPMLGPLRLPYDMEGRLGWCIAGGESGPLAKIRDTPLRHFDDLHSQCRDMRIPYFQKQLAQISARKDYKRMAAWPTRLQVREQPRLAA